jgi:hypothetical protein
MSSLQLDLRARRMFLADWFARLADEAGLQLDQYGSNDEAFTLGPPTGLNVAAKFIEAHPFLQFVSSDPARQDVVDDLALKAVARVNAEDLGDINWYSVSLAAEGFKLASPFSMGSFIQQLGNQTRILGWRRLGSNVLIEFVEELPADWDEKNVLLAPKGIAHVHMAIPAPRAGFLSSHIARGTTETIAAICTFALGRAVALPPTVFPSKPEKVSDLNVRRIDPAILTLARKSVPLDIFSPIGVPGGLQFFERMRAAFLTFDAALHQQHNFVASILYVVTAEAITTPNVNWRDSKLTTRFINFFDELIPADLDTIVAHANFEDAFQIPRGTRTNRSLRRALLDQIYELRSGLVHSGLRPSYQGFGISVPEDMRRSLLADFAEVAILGYLGSPRSSVVGHPEIGRTENKG